MSLDACLTRQRTRIVATLGPASSNEPTLRAMILAGLNVVRINFSHAKPEVVREQLSLVRRLSAELKQPIGILGDLRGPRIRVGEMSGGQILLENGGEIVVSPKPIMGTPARISVSYPGLVADLEPGADLLLDDGNLLLRVQRFTAEGDIVCRIVRGGLLSSNRGINLPGRKVGLPSVTEKDLADLDLMIAEKFDFVALSFVQSAADVRLLKDEMRKRGAEIPIIAKIEKKSAVDDIREIVQEAYGIMVARGDLAIEMSLADVPIAQKQIIQACLLSATPVITATQMLESMTTNHKPTRAEASDVANAILDGTDAIMLSGESAIGKYPVETIQMMASIARRVEGALTQKEIPSFPVEHESWTVRSAVSASCQRIASKLKAKAMVAYTESGATARWIMCHRPETPLLALCPDEAIRRRLALSWGVQTRLAGKVNSFSEMQQVALESVKAEQLARPGDIITVSAGQPFGEPDGTNILCVERVP
jgi:pyruvate kinase